VIRSDASVAPQPPCCSIVFCRQACHFRNTCLLFACHGGREQVGYQLRTLKTWPGPPQRTSWADYLGDTTKPFRFKSCNMREDCCGCTLFLPSRSNDPLRHHPRLMSHLSEYVVRVTTRYRYYSFREMGVCFSWTHRWI